MIKLLRTLPLFFSEQAEDVQDQAAYDVQEHVLKDVQKQVECRLCKVKDEQFAEILWLCPRTS